MKKILILIFLMAVAAASVKAQPGVTPSITASHTSACFGTTVIVETPKAAGGLFYQFERNGSPIYPNGSPQWFAEETQQGTHTYRVRVGNTGSWSNWSDPITVTIAKTGAPVLSLIGPAKVCEGSPYGLESNYPLGTPTRFEWLDVNSGKSYQWVSNNPSIPNLPTAAGVYSFKLRADSITITGGCWSEWSNTVNVEIYPAPTTKPVINPVADVCLGNPLTFSTQVKAYPDYRWQEVNSGTITSGPNVKTITQSAAGSYTYRLRVNVHSSCGTGWSLWGDPVTAAVKNLPAAPVIAPVTNVCFGSELVFTAPQGYAKYAWTETGSGSSDTTTVNTLSKTAVGTYTYRLSVLGANGCWSNLSAAVSGEVYALPAKQTINPVADVCFGETLTLETAAGFARYGWRETTSLT
ncbi:MAG: hypothetical protein LBS69_13120, partial [Prevotellaceae bacterium]|nr:hypothetical protein [Prevotellaceae bacterium]